jgi:hypothetical protein
MTAMSLYNDCPNRCSMKNLGYSQVKGYLQNSNMRDRFISYPKLAAFASLSFSSSRLLAVNIICSLRCASNAARSFLFPAQAFFSFSPSLPFPLSRGVLELDSISTPCASALILAVRLYLVIRSWFLCVAFAVIAVVVPDELVGTGLSMGWKLGGGYIWSVQRYMEYPVWTYSSQHSTTSTTSTHQYPFTRRRYTSAISLQVPRYTAPIHLRKHLCYLVHRCCYSLLLSLGPCLLCGRGGR